MKNLQRRGFSLIEVLVALFVLSVGMMGVAALFVTSLQSGGSAILRTRAINFAEDIADRMRANRISAPSYVTTYDDEGADNGCSATSTTDATSCTGDELAAHDLFTWKNAIASATTGLPGGEAKIEEDTTTTPPTYTVTIAWTEREEDQTYIMVFQTS